VLYANDIRRAVERIQDATMAGQKEMEQKSWAGLEVREDELQLIDCFLAARNELLVELKAWEGD
jgi:hypothetical protein